VTRFICGFGLLYVFLSIQSGCASGPKAHPKVSYQTDAKENFLKGKKAFDKKDYVDAVEYFTFVKQKFPYSTYAVEADLLLADCHFRRDQFTEATDAYTDFIKLHPKNEKVPYAAFQIAMSAYQQIPDNWWFAPPSYELDQRETTRAMLELQRYLAQYPDDSNVPEAQAHLKKCKRRLAEQINFVMDFYKKREHPRGVLWRADELLTKYPGSGFDDKALYFKAEALLALGDATGARASLDQLMASSPQGAYAKDAKKLLERIPPVPPAAGGGSSP
jgi:outer membrane protein assembly factor BamD